MAACKSEKPATRTALYADAACRLHDPGWGHPEAPRRFDAILAGLEDAGLVARLQRLPGRQATVDEVARVHARDYIDQAREEITTDSPMLSTGDTNVCEASFDAALAAAGGVLGAVDAVMRGEAENAFCVVRPPGHHASVRRGMGFCVFNNVAIAARHARAVHGAERVLIVDWDVHHGNGTQDIFNEDGSVLFFSTHQWPWYPGTGRADETGVGAGKGRIVNCPFLAGAGRNEICGALRDRLRPAAMAFQPDIVLISAGFDSRIGDPLGQFRLRDSDFAELTGQVREIADTCCAGRVVSVLEGGYAPEGLAAAATAHVRALLD